MQYRIEFTTLAIESVEGILAYYTRVAGDEVAIRNLNTCWNLSTHLNCNLFGVGLGE
jgi:hypothetical protein